MGYAARPLKRGKSPPKDIHKRYDGRVVIPPPIWCQNLVDGGKRIQMPSKVICYCFEYTADDIRKDVIANGRSTIMEQIADAKRFGQCQCQEKNPGGT